MNGMLALCFQSKTAVIPVDDIQFIIHWPIRAHEWTPEIHGPYPDRPHRGDVWLQTPKRILDQWLRGSWT